MSEIACTRIRRKKGTVIGTDLGTTFSVVGVCQNGKAEIIANEVGSRITPSAVSFGENDRLVGDAVKHQMISNPTNRFYSINRLLGLRYSDPQLQRELKQLHTKLSTLKTDHMSKFRIKAKQNFFLRKRYQR
jgi:molecular chaperone DnaK (HSP70)